MCHSKKSKFIKEKEVSGLSSLGITPLDNIPLLSRLLFQRYYHVNTRYKMNEIGNKFYQQGVNLCLKYILRQPGFTYSGCGQVTKTKKEYKNLKKQEINDIFIKTNQIKFVFKMTWLMEILKS